MENTMAMMRTRSTSMPAALATTPLWPTARSCWPSLVRMMTTLNRQSSATTPNVAIGTLTMENSVFIAGSCITAAAAAITPS